MSTAVSGSTQIIKPQFIQQHYYSYHVINFKIYDNYMLTLNL